MGSEIVDKIQIVQEKIAAACQRSGRKREDVRLVAVSKTFPAEAVREAYSAGLTDFGENRVQEAASKITALDDLDITWHLIGHLQTNKARTAREMFPWIHSVDSVRLASKLDQSTAPGNSPLTVLLEVNLGGEESKAGIPEAEVIQLAEQLSPLTTIQIRGLMVIPPFLDDPEQVRPYFRRLRELACEVAARNIPRVTMRELSMGMSHDFEVAIEEGATIVRVGTAIFGGRD
jgi:PLP dependent protein